MEEDIDILKECIEYETFGKSVRNRRNKLDTKCYTALENILNELDRLQKENKELKEYIFIAPNLGEMQQLNINLLKKKHTLEVEQKNNKKQNK